MEFMDKNVIFQLEKCWDGARGSGLSDPKVQPSDNVVQRLYRWTAELSACSAGFE
jgi:hypothetical protein